MGTRDARHQAYGKFLRRNAVLGCSRGEADRCGRSGPVPKVKIDAAAVVILRFPARTNLPNTARSNRSTVRLLTASAVFAGCVTQVYISGGKEVGSPLTQSPFVFFNDTTNCSFIRLLRRGRRSNRDRVFCDKCNLA